MIVRPVAGILVVVLTILAVACASTGGSPEPSASPTATVAPPSTATPVSTPTPVPTPEPRTITISAVGDISLARQVVDRMQANGPAYPFALVTQLFDGDIVIGNLEGALTDEGTPWPKGYNFRTPPELASGLREASFDVVSLANNHTMDYGVPGLEETLRTLDALGIAAPGAGSDAADACAPAIVTVDGLRVAFLAYVATPDEGGGFSIQSWAAGPAAPGLAIGTPDAIARDVAAARQTSDFVVVLVHAGDEYRTRPNATQVALAEAALAAGADAYIGAHAHVVQPVEQRGDQLIAWGLGNFVFDLDPVDLANIPQPRVSLVLEVTLTEGAGVTGWRAEPVTLDDNEDRPRPATPAEAAALERLLEPATAAR